jgi:hypothetical protein
MRQLAVATVFLGTLLVIAEGVDALRLFAIAPMPPHGFLMVLIGGTAAVAITVVFLGWLTIRHGRDLDSVSLD